VTRIVLSAVPGLLVLLGLGAAVYGIWQIKESIALIIGGVAIAALGVGLYRSEDSEGGE
jgi:small neutral amino acid transporter SnatA (MarC family)